MSSTIRAIYTFLANQAVTVDSITPTAYDLDELPNTLTTAVVPCRLLTPMTPRGEARDGQFIAMGKLAAVTWHITDLMLWRSAAAGIGLEDIAATLVDYADAYLEMLRQHRSVGQAQCHILGFRFVYGTFEWPEGSGNEYHGVSCEVDIEEIKSGC